MNYVVQTLFVCCLFSWINNLWILSELHFSSTLHVISDDKMGLKSRVRLLCSFIWTLMTKVPPLAQGTQQVVNVPVRRDPTFLIIVSVQDHVLDSLWSYESSSSDRTGPSHQWMDYQLPALVRWLILLNTSLGKPEKLSFCQGFCLCVCIQVHMSHSAAEPRITFLMKIGTQIECITCFTYWLKGHTNM